MSEGFKTKHKSSSQLSSKSIHFNFCGFPGDKLTRNDDFFHSRQCLTIFARFHGSNTAIWSFGQRYFLFTEACNQ